MKLPRRDFLKSTASVVGSFGLFGTTGFAAPKHVEHMLAKEGTPHPMLEGDAAGQALRFLILGDWGWVGTEKEESADGQTSVADAMSKLGDARHPAFVLTVGDNIYHNGVKTVDDARWNQTFEDIYSGKSLQIPWHATLGNHDYRQSVQAQIDYSKKSKRWRMPDRYYSFVERTLSGTSIRFVVLDTNPFVPQLRKGEHSDCGQQDTAAQLAWFEKTLAESKEDWKILVGHHPLWTGGVRRNQKEQNLCEILPPIMKRHGVAIYFCGHEHDAQHIEVDGIHNLVIGNGGDTRPTGALETTRYAENGPGFGYASISATEARVHYVNKDGVLRHTALIPKPSAIHPSQP